MSTYCIGGSNNRRIAIPVPYGCKGKVEGIHGRRASCIERDTDTIYLVNAVTDYESIVTTYLGPCKSNM